MTMKAVIVNAGNRSKDVLHVEYGDGKNHKSIDIPVGGQHVVSLVHGTKNTVTLDAEPNYGDEWHGDKVVKVETVG